MLLRANSWKFWVGPRIINVIKSKRNGLCGKHMHDLSCEHEMAKLLYRGVEGEKTIPFKA